MSTSTVSIRRSIQKAILGVAGLAGFGALGAAAVPDQPSPPSRIEDVSLADVDLSTPKGVSTARERLHAMARRICTGRTDNRGVSSQAGFDACVDKTAADALGNISRLRQSNATVRNSVTRAGNVSVADLNLSTIEGYRVARERLKIMARRLCAELARNNDLTYRPNWAACVDDTIVGAMAQAKVLAAEKETRMADRYLLSGTP